jgi:hypothetical protein
VADLESQLKFLREALALLPAEPDRYKQLAAGLRVLVCGFRQNRPLLLDLMDELELGYLVSPIPDLPFPLQMVDELDQEPDVDLGAMSIDEVWAYHRSRGKSYSLREYVARGLAVYFDGRAYSYADLIRTLAEQSGLGHEDWDIDQNLPEMESFEIGGYQSQVAPLIGMAAHVIDASVLVIRKAISLGYVPHYLRLSADGTYELPPLRSVA